MYYNLLVYTDPTQSLYRALGLAHNVERIKPGNTQRFARLVNSIFQPSKFLSDFNSDSDLLGGEFILGPGFVDILYFRALFADCSVRLSCTFSNRMTKAGRYTSFDTLTTLACSQSNIIPGASPSSPSDSMSSLEDEEQWMERRRLSWLRLQDKRRRRRGAEHYWQEPAILTERRLTIIETAEDEAPSDFEGSDD